MQFVACDLQILLFVVCRSRMFCFALRSAVCGSQRLLCPVHTLQFECVAFEITALLFTEKAVTSLDSKTPNQQSANVIRQSTNCVCKLHNHQSTTMFSQTVDSNAKTANQNRKQTF